MQDFPMVKRWSDAFDNGVQQLFECINDLYKINNLGMLIVRDIGSANTYFIKRKSMDYRI